ncbi:glycosyltransferase [Haloplanus salinarum]|uniref:glycosyltransferase n=1 Tax=Haloplanus salinarum TaxID=1912324 RepID=UPI00214AF6F4|nr:glycosyltransferase [Haloplanus salinarum]
MIDIAFIIGNLNKEHGGAQQLLFDICRHLPDSEFETTVYYMFGEGTFREELEQHGTTVVDLGASSNYDLGAFYRLIGHLRRSTHDILHTNSPISGVWGRTAGRASRIPHIVSVEHNVHSGYSRFTRTVNGVSLPLADVVVGVTGAVSDSYSDWEEWLLGDTTKRRTIHNGVDVDAITATFDRSDEVLDQYTPFSPSDCIIGTVGKHLEQKGFSYIIQSFPEIKQEREDAKLLILGDGPLREELETAARETGYDEDIHFTGYVPEVYPFLPNFDVAVFPSLWEGFGLTVAEAMIAKRPVVGTTIPAFDEVIGDTGLLVKPEDPSAIATAVVRLLENPELRQELAEQGYKRAIHRFSIRQTVDKYADLYRELAPSL